MSVISYLYMLACVMAACLMVLSVAFLIVFGEFEQNQIDKVELCNFLNRFVLSEHLAPFLLATLLFLSGQWLAFLITAPMAAYNLKKIRDKDYMFDVSQMKFRRVPWRHRKERFIKIGFYLFAFFFYLYCLIVVLVENL
ncbi:cornichon [Mycena galericulata]|nr:cornichon [Mycena galericulata]